MLEPRSGRFWRELSPGDDVQAAVNACPEGGCILLRPGTHALTSKQLSSSRVGLSIVAPVSIFGRGQATLQSPGRDCTVDINYRSRVSHSLFTLDGLTVQSLASSRLSSVGVSLYGGSSRLQSCVITGPSLACLRIMAVSADYTPPVIIKCRCGDEKAGRDFFHFVLDCVFQDEIRAIS